MVSPCVHTTACNCCCRSPRQQMLFLVSLWDAPSLPHSPGDIWLIVAGVSYISSGLLQYPFHSGYHTSVKSQPAVDSTRAVGSCVRELFFLLWASCKVWSQTHRWSFCFVLKNQACVPGAEVSFPVTHRRTDRWRTVKKTTKPSF